MDAPKTFTPKRGAKKKNRKALLIAPMPMDSMYVSASDGYMRPISVHLTHKRFLDTFIPFGDYHYRRCYPFALHHFDSILIAQLA